MVSSHSILPTLLPLRKLKTHFDSSQGSTGQRSGPLAPCIAFITGGARGLGNAIAVSFAKEGARGVAIVDVNGETLNEGKKVAEGFDTKCLAIQANVTQEADMECAVEEAVREFGRIDYAANFSGILGSLSPKVDLSLEEWQKCMDVNCNGVFLSTKYELRQMMKQESIEVTGPVPQRGAMVNCASANSVMSLPPYTASKLAVLGITKTAALEARDYRIRVNAISPSFLLTNLPTPVVGNAVPQEMWEAFVKRQGRLAGFEEVGDVIVLMTSPRMSLVNGVNLHVDK